MPTPRTGRINSAPRIVVERRRSGWYWWRCQLRVDHFAQYSAHGRRRDHALPHRQPEQVANRHRAFASGLARYMDAAAGNLHTLPSILFTTQQSVNVTTPPYRPTTTDTSERGPGHGGKAAFFQVRMGRTAIPLCNTAHGIYVRRLHFQQRLLTSRQTTRLRRPLGAWSLPRF